MELITRSALALLPVLLFLTGLILLDAYRLVRPWSIARALGWGAVAAAASYAANGVLLEVSGLSPVGYALTIGPVIEELLKALYIVYLLRTQRVGFLVDAAIVGFAVGTGFALVENVYYLSAVPEAPRLVWMVRGLGTAIMHGGATAIFALLGRLRSDVEEDARWTSYLPGYAAAIVLHTVFNRLLFSPLATTVGLLVVFPLLMRAVFRLSERRLGRWLGAGFDRDSELLALIKSGRVTGSPLGRYLYSLRNHFQGETMADMLCLLRLQAELALRAKGELILRREGFTPQPDPQIAEKLTEIRYLERRIGKAGLIALRPVGGSSGGRRWERHRLERNA